MTRKEAYEKHKALWNEIAKMLDEGIEYKYADHYKSHAMERLRYYDHPMSNCYACETSVYCEECLVVWGGKDCMRNGEFMAFRYAIENKDYSYAKELAYQIVNLPLREGLDMDIDVVQYY